MDNQTTLIRRIRPEEGQTLREVRFRMLTESPNAFGVPLAMMQAMTDEQWTASATHLSSAPSGAYFFAEIDGEVCGTVECEACPPLVLTRDQALILARAVNGAAPAPHELTVLGMRYAGAAQQLLSVGAMNSLGLIMTLGRTGLGFFDMLRVGTLAYGPADPADTAPMSERDTLIPPQTAYISAMWVSPEARGRGIGAQLLDGALGFARAAGIRHIILFVTETQTAARALYERHGFAATSYRMRFPPNPALWLLGMLREL